MMFTYRNTLFFPLKFHEIAFMNVALTFALIKDFAYLTDSKLIFVYNSKNFRWLDVRYRLFPKHVGLYF